MTREVPDPDGQVRAAINPADRAAPATAPATTAPATTAPATPAADNPLYAAWSKFEVGSSTTFEADLTPPSGRPQHFVETVTLEAITPDGVTVEAVSALDGRPGRTRLTVPAEVPATAARRTAAGSVDAMGRTFPCQVFDMTPAVVGRPTGRAMTVYLSADVPGGIVKTINPQPGGPDVSLVITACDARRRPGDAKVTPR